MYFDGCPGHEALLVRLRELMADLSVDASVTLTRIGSAQEAERARLIGSPTLRVDGRDVAPTVAERDDYGLRCRVYASADGLAGTIPRRADRHRALAREVVTAR
jgi:hypothetical protein